jgi:hypothetical protein
VAYLGLLVLALLPTMWVLHLARGEGAFQPLVYVQTYSLQLLPGLMFGASMATLCDAWAPLMGKRGDALYFMLWIAQLGTLPASLGQQHERMKSWTLVDTSGLALLPTRLEQLTHETNISIGDGSFDALLPAVQLPADFWTTQMMAMRLGSALLSLMPLMLALLLFHRFSPDKVRARSAGSRFTPLAWMHRLLRPLATGAGRLLAPAARLPGLPGQMLADMLITLMAHPVSLLVLVAAWLAGAFCDSGQLPGLLVASTAVWGVLISDLSVRDHQCCTVAMGAAVPGGPERCYLRQWLASLLLGLLFTAGVMLRWLLIHPAGAMALLSGLVALSAAASLLGRSTRTGRSFLALFLFGLYVSTQVKGVAWVDAVGFNGAATAVSTTAYLLGGLALVALGHTLQRRPAV